jgi:ACS family tartrate transporter-like MFS transporter
MATATTPSASSEDALERSAIRRMSLRLLPFLIAAYFIAFVDRVNVGFAALQMNHDLGFNNTTYGIAGGIFFFGYFLFEVPSNILLEKFGARRWIMRIMVSWGIASGLTALVTGAWSFIGLRFLLGAMEAGLFPGVILYLTYWFPSAHRAKIVGIFMIAIPLSSLLGSPVSSAILGMEGVAGLHGWQWLFMIEAIPAVVLGLFTLVWLPDKPATAAWLPQAERDWLARRLAADEARIPKTPRVSLWKVLSNNRVLLLALVYAGSTASNYGLTLWQPQILKTFGLSNMQVGLANSVPFAFGCVAMILWGRRSDRVMERRWHTALPLFLCGAGLVACLMLTTLWPTLIALTVTLMGVYALKGPFWAITTEGLPIAISAASIAAINSIGNLAGFVGPFLIGYIKDATGSFVLGLLPLIAFAFVAGATVLLMGRDRQAGAHAPAE